MKGMLDEGDRSERKAVRMMGGVKWRESKGSGARGWQASHEHF